MIKMGTGKSLHYLKIQMDQLNSSIWDSISYFHIVSRFYNTYSS